MSSIIPILKAKIERGKIFFNKTSNTLLKKILGKYAGQKIDIVIKKSRSTRSIKQNSYYWGVVLQLIEDYTGTDKQDLSIYFREKFLKKEIRKIYDKKFTIIRGTSKLKTYEFAEYTEQIRKFALEEYKIDIPKPEEAVLEYEFEIDEEAIVFIEDIPFIK